MRRDWSQMSEFKYLECVLDEQGTDDAACRKMIASGRDVAVVIRSLVNARVCIVHSAA